VSAPGGITHGFGYDGSLPTSISTSGPVPGSVSFVYDNDFAMTSHSVNGGPSVGLVYDDDGLLVQSGELSLGRDAATGFVTTTNLGQVTDGRSYTNFGELDLYTATFGSSAVLSYDLDRDGTGDVPHRPVRLFSLLVEKAPPGLVLLGSLFVNLIDTAERVMPVFTPDALVDQHPAMNAIAASVGGTTASVSMQRSQR